MIVQSVPKTAAVIMVPVQTRAVAAQTDEEALTTLLTIDKSLKTQIDGLNKMGFLQLFTAAFATLEVAWGTLAAIKDLRFGPAAFAITSLIELINSSAIGLRALGKSWGLQHVEQNKVNAAINLLRSDGGNLPPQQKQEILSLELESLSKVVNSGKHDALDNALNTLVSCLQLGAAALIAAGAIFHKKQFGLFQAFKDRSTRLQKWGQHFEKFETSLNSMIARVLRIDAAKVKGMESIMALTMLLTGFGKLNISGSMPKGPLQTAIKNEALANWICMLESVAQIFPKLDFAYTVYASGSLGFNAIQGLTSQSES